MKAITVLLTFLLINSTYAEVNTDNIKKRVEGIENLTQLAGKSSGYNDYYKKKKKRPIHRRQDGYVDFGMVIPSLTRKDILFFDLNRIISPKSDQISIAKQKIDIPSNLSIPRQKESYIFLPFKLKKPEFRAFVPEPGDYKLTVIHGKFKVQTVLDKILDGKPIFDVINDFQFLGGGQLSINSRSKTSNLDIDVNRFSLTGAVKITAPRYDSETLTMFSMPLESIDGYFHPTDIQYIDSGKTEKATINATGNPHFTLNILTDQVKKFVDPFVKNNNPKDPDNLYLAEFNKISLCFLPVERNSLPSFLDIPKAPKVAGSSLVLFPPKKLSKTTPTYTVVQLVQAEQLKNGKLVSEHKTVLWSKKINGWSKKVQLPNIKIDPVDKAVYRYEVSFIATSDEYVQNSDGIEDFSLLSKNYLVIE